MIEFNVSSDVEDLQRILDQIKGAGIVDAVVNVKPKPDTARVTRVRACPVPIRRLQQIARIMDVMIDGKKLGLLKSELVELLVADDGGLSPNSASVYISNASGAGVIEKTQHGYILSEEAREELL